jgi:hypothetical protein
MKYLLAGSTKLITHAQTFKLKYIDTDELEI